MAFRLSKGLSYLLTAFDGIEFLLSSSEVKILWSQVSIVFHEHGFEDQKILSLLR